MQEFDSNSVVHYHVEIFNAVGTRTLAHLITLVFPPYLAYISYGNYPISTPGTGLTQHDATKNALFGVCQLIVQALGLLRTYQFVASVINNERKSISISIF